MRSAIAIAALAAGALAVPYKRDTDVVVTDVDVVYATDVVTVWATAAETTTAAAETTTATEAAHYGHHWSHSWSYESSSSETVAPTTPSTTTTPSSTYVPPPPTSTTSTTPTTTSTSTTPTSTYVAPAPPTTTSTSTWVKPTSAAPTSSAAAAPTSYSELVVYHHNLHRANHSAPDLEWSDDLANSAQDIAASCVYAHNVDADGGGYGQNIAAGVESNNISAIITDLFYNGEVGWYNGLYGESQPDMTNFEHWGHFSQIVWKATTSVGCATQYCPNGLGNVGSDVAPYFTVCNYKSPGNYANEYGSNIGSPLGHATADWNTGS